MPRRSITSNIATIAKIGEAVNKIDGWCYVEIGSVRRKFLRGEFL